MPCGKRWARALSIDHLHKDDTKTKAHVEQLISRWKVATKMMGAGWGDKTSRIKKDGEWVSKCSCLVVEVELVEL